MKKIAIAVSGASGSIYAQRLIDKLAMFQDVQLAVVFSQQAPDVWNHELGTYPQLKGKAEVFDLHNYQAPFASGSSTYQALVVCPCSMGTLGRIAQGISDNLISRAADVMLKERRKLICVVRETPFNLIHLDNMKKLSEAGGIICPASPSFYSKPDTIEALVDTVVDRVIQLLGISMDTYRWNE